MTFKHYAHGQPFETRPPVAETKAPPPDAPAPDPEPDEPGPETPPLDDPRPAKYSGGPAQDLGTPSSEGSRPPVSPETPGPARDYLGSPLASELVRNYASSARKPPTHAQLAVQGVHARVWLRRQALDLLIDTPPQAPIVDAAMLVLAAHYLPAPRLEHLARATGFGANRVLVMARHLRRSGLLRGRKHPTAHFAEPGMQTWVGVPRNLASTVLTLHAMVALGQAHRDPATDRYDLAADADHAEA